MTTPAYYYCYKHERILPTLPKYIKKGQGLKCCKSVKGPRKAKEQHIDEIKIHGKVELIGEFLGTKTETKYRCLVHDEVWPASPENIKQGHGLQCCQREGMGAGAEIKRLRAKEKYDSVIEKIGLVKRVGDYINDSTAIDHYCLTHGKTRKARPNDIKGGHGLGCCKEAKARSSGSPIDTVWRALLGRLSHQGNTFIYLYEFEIKTYAKYGIAFDPEERAASMNYGQKLMEPREYPNREQAVLIEQAFKYGWGEEFTEVMHLAGSTELTMRTPEEFLEIVNTLENELLILGKWKFARKYCDPSQLRIAENEVLKGEADF